MRYYRTSEPPGNAPANWAPPGLQASIDRARSDLFSPSRLVRFMGHDGPGGETLPFEGWSPHSAETTAIVDNARKELARPSLRQVLQQALEALTMSSPHTDAAYRWKAPEWQAQRRDAINALAHALGQP